MSRFRKLSQTLWHCQYHIVWTPKYRFKILTGEVAEEVEECIRIFSLQQKSEIIVLSVQVDHVHLLVLIPPKISVSKFIEIVKGRTAIRVLNKFRNLRQQPYWGNRFWTRGYCVDTVGLDTEMIRKYVKYQDGREK
jgi:putative transposase